MRRFSWLCTAAFLFVLVVNCGDSTNSPSPTVSSTGDEQGPAIDGNTKDSDIQWTQGCVGQNPTYLPIGRKYEFDCENKCDSVFIPHIPPPTIIDPQTGETCYCLQVVLKVDLCDDTADTVTAKGRYPLDACDIEECIGFRHASMPGRWIGWTSQCYTSLFAPGEWRIYAPGSAIKCVEIAYYCCPEQDSMDGCVCDDR